MFTGLIQTIGTLIKSTPTPTGRRLEVDPGAWDHHPALGDSIAVSGCCLTLAAPRTTPDEPFAFDVIHETLEKTRLGRLELGDPVNLEHAVTASTLMGGHFVQGHIDAVGTVEQVQTGDDYRIMVRPPPDLMRFIAPKGSITIDGVSMTIAMTDPARGVFELAIIPTTLEKTTLGQLAKGDPVNLEADILAKTTIHYIEHYSNR